MKKYLLVALVLTGVFMSFGLGAENVYAVVAGEKGCTENATGTDAGAASSPTVGKPLVCLGNVWTVKIFGPTSGGLPEESKVPTTGDTLIARIGTITNWVFAVFVAISVIFIVLAAFQFVTAGGKPEEVSMARQKLIYAVIGIAIALLARALPAVLRNILIT